MSELLSLGWQEKVLTEENHRTGAMTVKTVDYRLLVHNRHRSQFYIQWRDESGPIEPLQPHTGNTTKVTPLGTVRTRMASGNHPPAEPDRKASIDDWAG